MRDLLKLAAAAAAVALSAPAAHAQQSNYTFPKQQIGAWSVYGYDDKCWMLQPNASNGTTISFAFRKGRPTLYISAEDRSWTALEESKRYDVRVELGPISGIMAGFAVQGKTIGPVLGVFVTQAGGDYFATLRRANSLKLRIDGTSVTVDVPMSGSGAAIDYFEKCSQALGVGPFNG